MSARRATRAPQGGLTLVEVMIVLGLTGLVAVALFASAQIHTTLQRQDGQVQQTMDNVRAGLEQMQRDARLSGTLLMGLPATNAVPPNNPALLYGVNLLNNVNNAANSDGPDAVRLLISDDTSAGVLADTTSESTTPISVYGGPAFAQGDLVVVSDFNKSVLYRLTGNPTAGTANNGTAATQLLPVTPPLGNPLIFNAWALVARSRLVTYQVDTTIFSGDPVLTMQDLVPLLNNGETAPAAQIVAEDIYDLQVALGVDGLNGAADGVITEVGATAGDDEWIFNVAGETLPQVLPAAGKMVLRISLVGRTSQASETLGTGRPAVEDRPAGAPDFYVWRVLTAEVTLRNLATN